MGLEDRAPLPLLRFGDEDEVRLRAFHARHPGVWVIGEAGGFWQARRAEPAGETIRGGTTLGELMDKLEAMYSAPP